jgi:hypothetical protein
MAGTRTLKVTTSALAACALAAGATWVVRAAGDEPGKPLWTSVAGLTHSSEVGPLKDVDDAAQLADAIVVAHVTGVTEGRPAQGWLDPTPVPEKYPWVQLTVDRVVKGSVKPGQVLNLELPPIPLEELRGHTEPDAQLFFLTNRAIGAKKSGYAAKVKPADYNIWYTIHSQGVIGARQGRLYTPMNGDEGFGIAYLASFEATTVDGAADRAARALR